MRKLLFFTSLFTLFILLACSKEKHETMTIVRDCTGTYLRLNEKDYQVCNHEKLSSFVDGTKVKAIFKKVKECKNKDVAVCMLLHYNEGWIHVRKIK